MKYPTFNHAALGSNPTGIIFTSHYFTVEDSNCTPKTLLYFPNEKNHHGYSQNLSSVIPYNLSGTVYYSKVQQRSTMRAVNRKLFALKPVPVMISWALLQSQNHLPFNLQKKATL